MAKRNKFASQFLGWSVILTVLIVPVVYLATREEALKVTASTVARGDVEQTVSGIAAGTVMPLLDSMIASEYLGKVKSINFKEGDHVSAGDILVELSHNDLDAQVALAEANLLVAESKLEQAKLGAVIYSEIARAKVDQSKAQQEQTQRDYQRLKQLAERKAISESDLQKSDVMLRVAQETTTAAVASEKESAVRAEEVKSAESMIKQVTASLEVAKAMREKAIIKAPFDGTVAKINVEMGESVGMGVPLLRLVQKDPCYVEVPFDESNVSEIKLGQEARINIDAYRGVDFKGTVDYISPVVQLNMDLSRTLILKVKIDQDASSKFLPGMSADVTILIDTKHDVLSVPSESLVREQYAYVIEKGRAYRRKVTLGIGNWRSKEITEGLKEGEQIVTSVTIQGLTDGRKIEIVPSLEVI
jgi:HlyD family secretion protein